MVIIMKRRIILSLIACTILSANLASISVNAASIPENSSNQYIAQSIDQVMIDNEFFYVLPNGTLYHTVFDPVTQRMVDEFYELEAIHDVRVDYYDIVDYDVTPLVNDQMICSVAAGATFTMTVSKTLEGSFEFTSDIDVSVDAKVVEAGVNIGLKGTISERLTLDVGTTFEGPDKNSGFSRSDYYMAVGTDEIAVHTFEDRTYGVYQLINGKMVYVRSETQTEPHTYSGQLPKMVTYKRNIR